MEYYKKRNFGDHLCDFITTSLILSLSYIFIASALDVLYFNNIPSKYCCCNMENLNYYYENFESNNNSFFSNHSSISDDTSTPFCLNLFNVSNTNDIKPQHSNIIPLTELYDKYGNSINQSGQYIELNPTMRKITEKYKLNLNNPILKFSTFAKYIRKFILMFNNCNQLVMYGYTVLSQDYLDNNCSIFLQ